jgi:hypothetical protein
MVAGQKIALGRIHAHQTVTIHVAEDALTIDLPDGGTRTVRRTTTTPVRNVKAVRPARSVMFSSPDLKHVLEQIRQASRGPGLARPASRDQGDRAAPVRLASRPARLSC